MKKVKGEPRKSPHLQKINNLNKVIFFAKGINRPEIPKTYLTNKILLPKIMFWD